jgi:hypothetical protein
MRRFFHPLLLSLVVIGMAELLSGCNRESDNPDAKTAEQVLGVPPDRHEKQTAEATRDVTVVKDTKVIDDKTGQTIGEKVESTPVKITEQKREKTDVDVKVGETKTTVDGAPTTSK